MRMRVTNASQLDKFPELQKLNKVIGGRIEGQMPSVPQTHILAPSTTTPERVPVNTDKSVSEMTNVPIIAPAAQSFPNLASGAAPSINAGGVEYFPNLIAGKLIKRKRR